MQPPKADYRASEKEIKMKKIQVLVLDDEEKNRQAAKEYFNKRTDIEVDFAKSYEQAAEMIEKKVYYYALIDLNFPEKEEDKPEELGFKFTEMLGELAIPWAIMTAGRGHGFNEEDAQCTFATHFLEKDKTPREYISGSDNKEVRLSSKRKTNSLSWKLVFECLEEANEKNNEFAIAKELVLSLFGMDGIRKRIKRWF